MRELTHYLLTILAICGAISVGLASETAKWPVEDGCGIYARLTHFNPIDGSIRFTMESPGFVQVRVGIKNGPCLDTPVNWDYYTKGNHEVRLNSWWHRFVPASDNIAVSLAIGSEADAGDGGDSTDLYLMTITNGKQHGRVPDVLDVVALTLLVDRESSMDSIVELSVNGLPVETGGIAPVNRKFGLRIDLEEPYRTRHRRDGFKAHVYIDGIIVYEAWEGRIPMTMEIDTSAFAPGKALLSVNLEGYYKNLAINNIIIDVSAPEADASGKE